MMSAEREIAGSCWPCVPSNYGRVAPTPATARQLGCDVQGWVEHGWVDFVTVSEFLFERDDLPIGAWKEVITTVPVYGGIECSKGSGQKNLTADEYRRAAAERVKAGADGIYLFNFFTSREGGESAYDPPFEVFGSLVQPTVGPHDQPGLVRPGVEFKIFQFPADKIPRIDGNPDDWSIVPESYAIGMDQLRETVAGIGDKRDPANLDVKVKVGWVTGQNHLYFLYEASDNYWDFAREPDLHNDIFELVIDGDLSGGPLIRQMHPIKDLRDQAGYALSLSRCPRSELSHLHAIRGKRLGDGVGLAAVDQGITLRQCGIQVQFQARRKRQAGAGVFRHAV